MKGQRYRGRDLPDGIQLEIDGKAYTVPRNVLRAAKTESKTGERIAEPGYRIEGTGQRAAHHK